MTPSSHRIDAGLWASAAAALVFAAVLVAPVVLSGDALYWHIAAGRWMIENQQVLRIDPFSYTYQGQPWEIRDWLSEILFAGAYVGAGWSGVQALVAAAAAAGAGLLAFHLARGRQGAITAIWLVLAFVAAAGAVTALPYLLALPCAVAWIGGLAQTGEKTPSLKLLPLMVLWTNLSDSFVFGLVVVAVLAIEAVVIAKTNRWNVARAWAVFAGLALLLSLITPNGVFGLSHAIRALATVGPVESAWPLLVALPAASVLLPHRRMALRVALIAGLGALAMMQGEAQLLFAAAAPLLAAAPSAEEAVPWAWRPVAALVFLVLAATAIRVAVPVVRHDDVFAPQAALAAVPENVKRQPVFNEVRFGGYLISQDVKPFLDRRPHYFASFRNRYVRGTTAGLLANTLTRYHIGWTILAPGNPAVRLMDGTTGWHRLYTDQWAVIHVRDGRQNR